MFRENANISLKKSSHIINNILKMIRIEFSTRILLKNAQKKTKKKFDFAVKYPLLIKTTKAKKSFPIQKNGQNLLTQAFYL